jgi:hypothetical protein
VLRPALRLAIGPSQIISAALLPALAGILLIQSTGHAVLRDRSDVFASGMLSPSLILMPLVTTLLTCVRFSSELAHRFTSVQRTRSDMRLLLATRYIAATVMGFSFAFLFSFLTYVTAFHIWPLLGDPGIDPASYLMTPEQAVAYTQQHEAFGSYLRFGDLPFGLVHASWFGFCAALYAAIGVTAVVLVRNRFLALALPMLFAFGETFVAELLGHPGFALYFSAIAFGLTYPSDAEVVAPHLILAVVVAVVAVITIRRIPTSGRLS